MIPQRKKTPEEIAALREGLGIPDELPKPGEQRKRPAAPTAPKNHQKSPAPTSDPVAPKEATKLPPREPTQILDKTPPPDKKEKSNPPTPAHHSLRKQELPLAPAPAVTHKSTLPTSRHDPDDIAEIRRRDALQNLGNTQHDPAAHLKQITAHWPLLTPAYLLACGAAVAAWKYVHHATPLTMLSLATLLAIYIFIKKKRSRHHSAILAIIILMTLVFGSLHYAPLFQNAP